MIRRRGDTPPEPFDTLDTGRDHITGPQTKNDGLHTHSWQKNVETAAALNNTIGRTAQ